MRDLAVQGCATLITLNCDPIKRENETPYLLQMDLSGLTLFKLPFRTLKDSRAHMDALEETLKPCTQLIFPTL
jgi:hypothetical protein